MSDISPEDGHGQGRAQTQDGDALKNEAQAARAKVGEATQSVKQEAAHFAEATRSKATEQVDRGKQAVTTAVDEFADAIRKASEALSEKDQGMAARLATQAADGLQALSRTVSQQNPEKVLNTVRQFGRDNPTAFLAGAVLAGVALGRFARSSAIHDPAVPPQSGAGEEAAVSAAAQDGEELVSAAPWPAEDGEAYVAGALGAEGGAYPDAATPEPASLGVLGEDEDALAAADESDAGNFRATTPGAQ